MWCLYRSMEYLAVGLYVAGLVLMVVAFVQIRRKAYLVLALFFALNVAWWVVNYTTLRQGLVGVRYRQVPEELRERFRNLTEEVEAVKAKYPDVLESTVARMHITFPVGPLLLVAGLFLLFRDQRRIARRISEDRNQAVE